MSRMLEEQVRVLQELNATQAWWLGQIKTRLKGRGMLDAFYLVCDVMNESPPRNITENATGRSP